MDVNLLILEMLFGLVGFAAARYGHKQQRPRQLILGIALIICPWLSGNPIFIVASGLILTGLLFWPRIG